MGRKSDGGLTGLKSRFPQDCTPHWKQAPLPGSTRLLAEFGSMGLSNWSSSFLAGYQQRSLQLLSRGLHISQLMTPFIFKESDGGLNPSYALCLLPHLSLILLSSSSSLTANGIRLGPPNLGNPGSAPYFKVHNVNPSHKAPFAM